MVVLAALLGGCASPAPDFYTDRNEYRGETTDMMVNNPLPSNGTGEGEVSFNATRIGQRNGITLYYFEVRIDEGSANWIEIEPGEALVLTVDGTELKYDGRGSAGLRKTTRGLHSESAIFLTTASDIRKVADAKAVKLKIIGKAGTIERTFAAENFERFKRFVASYLDRTQ